MTDVLRRKLSDGIGALQLRNLVFVQRKAPWLIGEEQLVARAMDRVEDPGERWTGPASDADLPAILAPAVRRRVLVARREDELLKLLDWLVKQGDAPDDLIRILLARGLGAPRSEATIRWLATVLVTTSRWKTFGPPILKQLLAAGGWEAMTLLLVESAKNAEAVNHPDRKRGIVGAIHEAVAVVLLHRLREAAAAGADGEACAALRGLAGLQPPARLSEQLHLLQKKHELPPDVLELVNLNLSLLRHGTTRGAQLFDAEVALNLYRESATLAAEV